MQGPLVSVIIPTYNRAHLIEGALASVLRQEYRPLEIIVVDDGSIDDTSDLMARKYPHLSYVRQANSGPSIARNHGVRLSSGEIIMFLDSDDEWLPGKVSRQVNLLQDAGPSACCCVTNAILRDTNGKNQFSFDVAEMYPLLATGLWTNPAEVLASRFLFFNQVVAVRRDAIVECGGFNEHLMLLEDWDLALRLSVLGPWAYTTEPFAVWNPGSNESLVTRAAKDRISLRESSLTVHQGALAREGIASRTQTADLLRRKIRNTQRELLGLHLAHDKSIWKRAAGNSITLAERCKTVISKRLHRWPEMQVQAFTPDLAELECEKATA
jgi:glycosyltransferase involved in cell wall biosynthesis